MARAKDAERAADSARQRESAQTRLNAILSQLFPGSEEYQKAFELGSEFVRRTDEPGDQEAELVAAIQPLIQQQQSRVASGGPATPLEARTNLAFEGLRSAAKPVDFEQDVLNILSGTPTTTAIGARLQQGTKPTGIEQELLNALQGLDSTSPIGGIFEQAISRANAPSIDDSVFRNALKLVEDQVNTEAAGRGTLGSGLRLEQLGRAGVDASIAEGQRQDRLRQEAYANALGLFDTGRNVESGIRDFSSNIFNVGEGLREREIGVENELVNMQLGRESNLTGIINANSNNRLNDLSGLLQRRTERSQEVSDFERILEENDQRSLRRTLGGAAGSILGLPFGPAGSAAGATFGSNLAGGGQVPNTTRVVQPTSTATNLLDTQRTQQTGTTTSGSPSLSRQSTSNPSLLEELLAIFGKRR